MFYSSTALFILIDRKESFVGIILNLGSLELVKLRIASTHGWGRPRPAKWLCYWCITFKIRFSL